MHVNSFTPFQIIASLNVNVDKNRFFRNTFFMLLLDSRAVPDRQTLNLRLFQNRIYVIFIYCK